MGSRTAIVVPAFEEAHRFPVARFVEFLGDVPDVSFVLVDDGSKDATLERLREVEAAAPERVRVLGLPANRGKAEAVRAGVRSAFEAQPEHVGYWDADLATPLAAVLRFRDLLDERLGVEIVFGARVSLLGREVRRSPLRHYIGRAAATVIGLALGLPVYDTQCGAKLFRATPLVRDLFEEPFLTGWLFDVEILARLLRARGGAAAGLVYEMPLEQWVDVPGSKLTPRAYLGAARDLVRLYWRYLC